MIERSALPTPPSTWERGARLRLAAQGVAASRRAWMLGAGALIAIVFLALRLWLAVTPFLAETYYDEAVTGLMGLAILRGIPQVFYWGQPYLGAVDAYTVAAAFWLLGPTTLVLRMTVVSVSVLWAWALWSIARRTAGEGFGFLAGLYVAVPPLFLSYIQLSSHGETVSLTFGALILAAAAWLMDPAAGPRGRAVAWTLLGLAGGLGWYSSQMIGMFLVAGAAAIVVARPRVLREPGPYVAVGLFFLASLPFWVWNAHHEWATFWHLATWGHPPASFALRIRNVGGALLETTQGYFWDGRAVHLPRPVQLLGWFEVGAVYLPAVMLAAVRLVTWGRRALRRERPWQDPLDLVVLAFWLTVAAHLATWFGTSSVLRYSMTFYATLPVLCATVLARLAQLGWPGRALAVSLGVLLLGDNALAHVEFVREASAVPYRPIDAAIARLDALGVRACYADSRIAQVITFESAERIVCADYNGLRNFAFLRDVDAVSEPAQVAIVTHRILRNPSPDEMAEALRLIGAGARRDEVGDYVIFHHWQPPDPRVRPIPTDGWVARASSRPDGAARAFDRQVWTRWKAPKSDGQWFELDFGQPYLLAQLLLDPGPFPVEAPIGLRVETSLDGRAWELAGEDPALLSGTHWWKGHPRLDDSGRVLVRMRPRPARYVRLVQLGTEPEGALWSIAELLAWAAVDAPWQPPPAARDAKLTAERALAHWMDDPGGPHPKRAPVTYEHRRAQVDWAAVFAGANRALELAPEWDEAHHLYAHALMLSGWGEPLDAAMLRARDDGAWQEAVRWAELADAQSGVWRSGRDAVRAEALERLGRPSDAAAVRAALAARPAPSPRARFGEDLELTAVELPPQARPGTAIEVRYAWHALRPMRRDYTAFVHVDGASAGPARRSLNQDHRLGGEFGTSRWAAGERAEETLTLVVPPDLPPGTYEVKIGVWLPETHGRLPVTQTDLPRARQAVVAGTLAIVP